MICSSHWKRKFKWRKTIVCLSPTVSLGSFVYFVLLLSIALMLMEFPTRENSSSRTTCRDYINMHDTTWLMTSEARVSCMIANGWGPLVVSDDWFDEASGSDNIQQREHCVLWRAGCTLLQSSLRPCIHTIMVSYVAESMRRAKTRPYTFEKLSAVQIIESECICKIIIFASDAKKIRL